MGVTAFNSSAVPPGHRPGNDFSVEWFDVLLVANDDKLMLGICATASSSASAWCCLAVPIGLAGALMLTQVSNAAAALVLHHRDLA